MTFENITDKEKLNYLNQLLENDIEFKIKFLRYFELKDKIKNDYKDNDLDTIIQEIFELFNDVDLEMYMPDCSYHSGYYDYYEDAISEQLCEDLFVEIVKELNSYFKDKNYSQALFLLVAIGKAIDLEPTVDDEYGLIYDYCEILSDYYHTLISSFRDKLKESDISIDQSKELIEFLLYNHINTNELVKFASIFYLIISTKDIALYFAPNITKFHIDIQLKILDLLDDDKAYINTAKQFYKENRNIAHKLLDKLNEVSTYEEYEKIAKECFEKDNSDFASKVIQNITYEKSKDFYLELLRYKVLHHRNIKEYKLYKQYLDEDEIVELQNRLCNDYRYDYCIEILSYEKRYDDILKLAQNEKNIDLHTVLNPIKLIYPDECFDIIKNKCDEIMNSFGRNRNSYNQICHYLMIISKVQDIKNKVDLYIKNNFLNRKPALPALKDELKKAGLI